MSELKDVEVVAEPMELVVIKQEVSNLASMVKEQDRPILDMVQALDSFDWRSMKPHQMALLLMQKPFQSRGGTLFLNFRQALLFAVRCFEIGLSPFGNDVWYDSNKGSVNLSLEGKRQLARNKGIDLGPPQFEQMEREWKDVPRMSETAESAKKVGFSKDVGYKCRLRIGDPKNNEHSEYTAWLSEWLVASSPVWKEKPEHMLQVRAQEKCLSMAMGTGASALPDEREIE